MKLFGAVDSDPQQPGLPVLLRGELGVAAEVAEKDLLVHILSVCGVPRPGKGKAIDHVRVAADRLLRLARPVHVIPLLSPQTPHSGAKCCRDQKIFARPLNRTCAGAHSGCLPHRSGTGEERPLIRHGFAVPPFPQRGEGFGGGPHLSSFVISSFMVYIYQEKWKGRRPGPICKKLVRLPPAFL